MINSKKLEKIEKVLGKEVASELEAQDLEALKHTIVAAESAMKTAFEELEANPLYQSIKENLKDITAGMKDVRKFQNAKIQLALHLLESKGS